MRLPAPSCMPILSAARSSMSSRISASLPSRTRPKGVEFDKIKTAEIKTDAAGHTTLLCGPASVKTESDKWRTNATLGLRLDNDTLDCDGLTWYAIPNAKGSRSSSQEVPAL